MDDQIQKAILDDLQQETLPEIPVENMTDAEVLRYYENNSLAAKNTAFMDAYELDIVERYGRIVAGKRQKAEMDAEKATTMKVRRNVQKYVDIYGTAQFLAERLLQNNSRLSREDPGPEVKVTVFCEGVEVTIGFADIQAAFAQRQNSQTIDLNRKMNDLLSLIKLVANQAKAKACKVDGRDYSSLCQDITWKAKLSQLNTEYSPE